jgi:hypothetical protein
MAIVDRREIEFDTKALISVIAGSARAAQAIGLPALRPTGVDFSPNKRRVRFVYEGHPAVYVASERIGALLASYCVRARIPMPRRTNKDIRIGADSVTLTFSVHFADPPAAW